MKTFAPTQARSQEPGSLTFARSNAQVLGSDQLAYERGRMGAGALEAEPGASWDFSKIPLSPPGREAQVQGRSPLPGTRMPGLIQAKLVVNEPGDAAEPEAEHVADQVMRMPAEHLPVEAHPKTGVKHQCAFGGTCSKCREGNAGHAQLSVRRAPRAFVVSPGVEAPLSVQRVLRAPGQELDESTRAFMEPRFGRDFSRVQVHADALAAESARAMGARAFTVSPHIVFGNGEASLATNTGRRLLAHELAHVVQQEGNLSQGHAAGSLASSLLLRSPLEEGQLARLSAGQLEARSKEIFRKAASEYLKANGKLVTEASLGQLRRQFTVGVLQGVKDGSKIVTLVGANDPLLEPYLKQAIQPGERLVESVSLTAHNAGTDLPNKTGQAHAHAEPPLSQQARAEGLTDSLLGSSNKGCVDCVAQMGEQSPKVAHVNPRVASRGSVAPSGSIPRPVTTTEVAINPANRYRGGRTPPRNVGQPATISGEIDTLAGGAATATRDVAETASVIVDDAALVASKGVRFAGLRAVLGHAVTGLEFVAILDTLKLLIELSYAWMSYEKNTQAPAEVHIAKLLQKNGPEIEAALKAHAAEAEEITKRQPALKVYANMEIVIEETWKTQEDGDYGSEGEPYDRNVSDITFKDLAISIYPVRKEKVVRNVKTSFSESVAEGFTKHFRYTLKTLPVEINFGETPQQRQERTFLHEIVEATENHQSARFIAGSHVGEAPTTKADDAEERRRQQGGEPSLQSGRDLEARKQYVRLYIEYTALHGPDDLYLDAIAYLKELEAEGAPKSKDPFKSGMPPSWK